jgi:hypothetical protein
LRVALRRAGIWVFYHDALIVAYPPSARNRCRNLRLRALGTLGSTLGICG